MPTWELEAIGVPWQIDTDTALSSSDHDAVLSLIDTFDGTYSRFRADSLVTRVAQSAGAHRFPPDIHPLMAIYRHLYEATGGRVSPLVGDTLAHLGLDASYRLEPLPGPPPRVPPFEEAVTLDGDTLIAHRPVTIDIGAVGKGFLVDRLSELLVSLGHPQHIVDGSGDLCHRGGSTLRVGLENPVNPGRVIGVAEVHHRALAASATQRRRWGPGLHHILDALTGLPAEGMAATWVVAETAALADGLSTALFLSGPSSLEEHFSFEWVTMDRGGVVRHSENFPGEVFG